MKRSCASLLLFALVGFIGCESKNTTPGGPGVNKPSNTTNRAPGTTGDTTHRAPGDTTNRAPGTTNAPGDTTHRAPGTTDTGTTNRPLVGQAEETFTLSVPTLSVKIKQGETKTIDISEKRGKNFDQDVTLKFEGLPKGVTIEPAAPVIKHGDTDAQVKIRAADDAAVGDFTVRVIGHPTKGADATSDLKITVTKR